MLPKENKGIIRTHYMRRATREVNIGGMALGGANPIRLQSMTTTDTNNIEATIDQTIRIANAGANYVRITAQGVKEAKALAIIKKGLEAKGYQIPLIADIHFNPQAALEAALHVSKIRINPGNYADKQAGLAAPAQVHEEYKKELDRVEQRFVPLLEVCKKHGVALRIGVNHGSLSGRVMNRYGDTPEGMSQSAMEFLHICRRHNFNDIVVSMKASGARVMVQATRLLVKQMDEAGMDYPIHLGVTEAGEGEDGRIKSAVGIGALLIDGIGDTLRVSLTEEPENEIPVAQHLTNIFSGNASKPSMGETPAFFNPFSYARRVSRATQGVGGDSALAVFANLSQLEISKEMLLSIGWQFDTALNTWVRSDTGADFIIAQNARFKDIPSAHLLPIVDFQHLANGSLANGQPEGFFMVDPDLLNHQLLQGYTLRAEAIPMLQVDTLAQVYAARRAIFTLHELGLDNPIILSYTNPTPEVEVFQLQSATLLGTFLIDGLADGIVLHGPQLGHQQTVSTSFAILQAAGARITKTEFVSCPGCGRTLFDLADTLKAVKSKTEHLKGLKIAVMGCIVNGPGEMADAHYGYVGSGPGRITLYKGQRVVKRNIPQGEALDQLIALIKSNGDWIDPKT